MWEGKSASRRAPASPPALSVPRRAPAHCPLLATGQAIVPAKRPLGGRNEAGKKKGNDCRGVRLGFWLPLLYLVCCSGGSRDPHRPRLTPHSMLRPPPAGSALLPLHPGGPSLLPRPPAAEAAALTHKPPLRAAAHCSALTQRLTITLSSVLRGRQARLGAGLGSQPRQPLRTTKVTSRFAGPRAAATGKARQRYRAWAQRSEGEKAVW